MSSGPAVLGDKTNTSSRRGVRSKFRKLAKANDAKPKDTLEIRQKQLAADLEKTLAMLGSDSRYSEDVARHYTDKDKHKDENVVELLKGQKKQIDALSGELTREKLALREKSGQVEVWRQRVSEMTQWKQKCLHAQKEAARATHWQQQAARAEQQAQASFHYMAQAAQQYRSQIEYLQERLFLEQRDARQSLEDATAELGLSLEGFVALQNQYESAMSSMEDKIAQLQDDNRNLVAKEKVRETQRQSEVDDLKLMVEEMREAKAASDQKISLLEQTLESERAGHTSKMEQQMESDSYMMKMMADSLESEIAAKKDLMATQESLISVIAEKDSQLEAERLALRDAREELTSVRALAEQFSAISESNRTVLDSMETNLDQLTHVKQETAQKLVTAEFQYAEQSAVLSQVRLDYLAECNKTKELIEEVTRQKISSHEATFFLQQEMRDQEDRHEADMAALKKDLESERSLALACQQRVLVEMIDQANLNEENSREALQEEIALLKKFHQEKLVATVDQLVGQNLETMNSLEEKQNAERAQFELEANSLENQCRAYREEIESLQRSHRDHLDRSRANHLAQQRQAEEAREKAHSLDVEILSKTHKNSMHSLTLHHAAEITALKKKHADELISSEQMVALQKDMRAQLEAEMVARLHALENGREESEKAAQRMHAEEVQRLKGSQFTKLENYKQQIAEMEARFLDSRENTAKVHKSEVDELECEYTGRFERLNEELRLISQSEQALKQKYQDALVKLASVEDEARKESESHQQDLQLAREQFSALKRNEKELQKLSMEAAEELQSLKKAHALEMQKALAIHREAANQMNQQHSRKLIELQMEHTGQRNCDKHQFEEQLSQMEEAMCELQAKHRDEMLNATKASEKMSELVELKRESYVQQLEMLRTHHKAELAELSREHVSQIAELQVESRRLHVCVDQLKKEVHRANEHAQAAMLRSEEEMANAQSTHLAEMERATNAFQMVVEEMQGKHDKELKEMRSAHSDDVNQLDQQHSEKLSRLEANYQSELIHVRELHADALSQTVAEFEGKFVALRQSHGEALAGLQKSLEEQKKLTLQSKQQVAGLEVEKRQLEDKMQLQLLSLKEGQSRLVEHLKHQLVEKEANILQLEESVVFLRQKSSDEKETARKNHILALRELQASLGDEKDAALSKLHGQSQQYAREMEEKMNFKNELLQEMNVMLENQQEIIDRARSEIAMLEESKTESQDTISGLQQKLVESLAYLDELGEALEKSQKEMTVLLQRKKQTELQMIDLEAFIAGQSVDMQKMNADLHRMAEALEVLTEQRDLLVADRKNLQAKCESLQESKTKVELSQLDLEGYIGAQMVSHQALVEEISELKEALCEADAINEEMAVAWQRQTESEVEARIRKLMQKLEGKLIEKTSTLL